MNGSDFCLDILQGQEVGVEAERRQEAGSQHRAWGMAATHNYVYCFRPLPIVLFLACEVNLRDFRKSKPR